MSAWFETPEAWRAAEAAGTVRRFGVLLKDTATGRIVAHLQEVGDLSRALPDGPLSALLGTTKVLAGAGAVASGIGAVAAIVGIGVSVLGFAHVSRRLDALDRAVGALDERLSRLSRQLDRLEQRASARDAAEVSAVLAAAEEAWHRTDRVAFLRAHVDAPLLKAERYWRALLGDGAQPGLLQLPDFSLDEAMAAYGRVVQLAAVRTQVLLLEDEPVAARRYAAEVAEWHARTTRSLSPVALAQARTGSPLDPTWPAQRAAASAVASVLREADVLLAQRVDVLDAVAALPLSPTAYVEAARDGEGVRVVPWRRA